MPYVTGAASASSPTLSSEFFKLVASSMAFSAELLLSAPASRRAVWDGACGRAWRWRRQGRGRRGGVLVKLFGLDVPVTTQRQVPAVPLRCRAPDPAHRQSGGLCCYAAETYPQFSLCRRLWRNREGGSAVAVWNRSWRHATDRGNRVGGTAYDRCRSCSSCGCGRPCDHAVTLVSRR